jgi:hypothetical protein
MNRSVLLRLLPVSRTGARLAGIVEIVETGERQSFRDADDLVSLLVRLHGDPAPVVGSGVGPDDGAPPTAPAGPPGST